MKKTSFLSGKNLLFFLFGTCLLMASFSCKKSKDPVNTQLLGTWLMTANHDSVYFLVSNLDGTLYVTSAIVKVFYTDGFVRYAMSSSFGLSPITDNSFDIVLEAGGPDGPTHIGGTFDATSMVCMGTFSYYQFQATVRTNYPYTISRP